MPSLSKKQKVIDLITRIISDEATWNRGIPATNAELLGLGFTFWEAADLEIKLADIVDRLSRKMAGKGII